MLPYSKHLRSATMQRTATTPFLDFSPDLWRDARHQNHTMSPFVIDKISVWYRQQLSCLVLASCPPQGLTMSPNGHRRDHCNICLCRYKDIYIHIHVYTHMSCIDTYTYICTHNMYIHIYLYLFICTCICISTSTYI